MTSPYDSDPFSDPATSTPVDLDGLQGSLLLVEVRGQEIGMETVNGTANPIRADVHVLDGKDSGKVLKDALIFPRVLIAQLRPRIGGMVLGRLGKAAAKPGKNAAWELVTPTPMDRTIGRQYLEQQQSGVPF